MADTSDVQNALAALIADVLYPAGVAGVGGMGSIGGYGAGAAYGNQAALAKSIAGLPVRVYRGWPVAQQLDPDMANGIAHVTVFEENGGTRLAPGRLNLGRSIPGAAPTVHVSVSGPVVTITGTPYAGNLVGVAQAGQSAVYAAQMGDTALSVANALAAQFPAVGMGLDGGGILTFDDGTPITLTLAAIVAGTTTGATLTFPATSPVLARTGSIGQYQRFIRHQTQMYRVSCWAPNFQSRDAICSMLDARLSDINWLQLSDQQAWMIWGGSRTNDLTTKAQIWRRDLLFQVTFWTSLSQAVSPVMFPVSTVTGGNGAKVTTIS